jgi:hypothetical protein
MFKYLSKKVFLQRDGVPGAYINRNKQNFAQSESHPDDRFDLEKYVKDLVATVLTGTIAVFTSITALSANIGKNLFGFGTATAPSITFNGDNNTGVYHPTTDTIGFTTGGVAQATIGTTGLKLTKTAFTQTINITTTVNAAAAHAGLITTQAASTAGGESTTFTVQTSAVLGSGVDMVFPTIIGYTGAGQPIVTAKAVGAGTFDITIRNVDPSVALNGALNIGFVVL